MRDWAAPDLLPEIIATCCYAGHCAPHECPSAEMSVQQSTLYKPVLSRLQVGCKEGACRCRHYFG